MGNRAGTSAGVPSSGSSISSVDPETEKKRYTTQLTRAVDVLLSTDVLLILGGPDNSNYSYLSIRDAYDIIAASKKGKSKPFEEFAIPHRIKDKESFFGFWGLMYNLCMDSIPHMGYYSLIELARDIEDRSMAELSVPPYFVVTTLSNSLFNQVGFPKTSLYEMHGSVRRWQCSAPSSCVRKPQLLRACKAATRQNLPVNKAYSSRDIDVKRNETASKVGSRFVYFTTSTNSSTDIPSSPVYKSTTTTTTPMKSQSPVSSSSVLSPFSISRHSSRDDLHVGLPSRGSWTKLSGFNTLAGAGPDAVWTPPISYRFNVNIDDENAIHSAATDCKKKKESRDSNTNYNNNNSSNGNDNGKREEDKKTNDFSNIVFGSKDWRTIVSSSDSCILNAKLSYYYNQTHLVMPTFSDNVHYLVDDFRERLSVSVDNSGPITSSTHKIESLKLANSHVNINTDIDSNLVVNTNTVISNIADMYPDCLTSYDIIPQLKSYSFSANVPLCNNGCKRPARPNIYMFRDTQYIHNGTQMRRYHAWKTEVMSLLSASSRITNIHSSNMIKLTILELGADVMDIRPGQPNLREVGIECIKEGKLGSINMIRIHPKQSDIADIPQQYKPYVINIKGDVVNTVNELVTLYKQRKVDSLHAAEVNAKAPPSR